MKKSMSVLRILLAFVILATLSYSFVSCSDDKPLNGYSKSGEYIINNEPTAVVLIIGNHANAMAVPQDAYDVINEVCEKAVYGGYVCAIIPDGTPTKIELTDDKNFFDENARNSTFLINTINDRCKKISNNIKSDLVADSPEVDLLGAFREAKNALSASRIKDIKNKQIVVISTGISTIGDLNLVDMNFIYAPPDINKIVEQLKAEEKSGVLPDLSGIDVTFIGTSDSLAEVAEPQVLDTTNKKFVKNLWTAIITNCSPNSINFEIAAGWDTPNRYTEDYDSKFKYVSVVTFKHEPAIDLSQIPKFDPNSPDPQPKLPEPPKVEINLSEKGIDFKPDEAIYLNESAANQNLRQYKEELNKFISTYPDIKIWIVGTTATTTKDGIGDVNLALNRAETVKNTLVTELGVPADNLLTIGLGARFPWHKNEFPNGNFDTIIAQDNRAVWLMTDTKDAEKFQMLKVAYDKSELLPEVMSRFGALLN